VLIKNKDNRGISLWTDFLFDMEEIADLYQNKKIQLLLKKIAFVMDSFDSKKKLNNLMKSYMLMRRNNKIKDVIDFIIENNILIPTEKLKNYDFNDEEQKEFYDKLMTLDYSQFVRLYQVQQDNTPFSTKHNTKGDEFDNVLVVIDDNSWKQSYNFDEYFSENTEKDKRYRRTSNLFYVVCSRAKFNLSIVCASKLSDRAQERIKEWFGENNYIKVT